MGLFPIKMFRMRDYKILLLVVLCVYRGNIVFDKGDLVLFLTSYILSASYFTKLLETKQHSFCGESSFKLELFF